MQKIENLENIENTLEKQCKLIIFNASGCTILQKHETGHKRKAGSKRMSGREQFMSREEGKNVLILSPLTGRAVPLEEVPDHVFSQKIIGDGMAVIPTEGKIVSPADAQIVSVADTGHAYGLKTEEGVELLIHVGLETVSLKGECFKIHVKPGDTVKAGDLLAEVDLEFLEERKINPITPVLICGGMKGRVLVKSQPGQVEAERFLQKQPKRTWLKRISLGVRLTSSGGIGLS